MLNFYTLLLLIYALETYFLCQGCRSESPLSNKKHFDWSRDWGRGLKANDMFPKTFASLVTKIDFYWWAKILLYLFIVTRSDYSRMLTLILLRFNPIRSVWFWNFDPIRIAIVFNGIPASWILVFDQFISRPSGRVSCCMMSKARRRDSTIGQVWLCILVERYCSLRTNRMVGHRRLRN